MHKSVSRGVTLHRWLMCLGFAICSSSLAAEVTGTCSKVVISADSDYGPLHWYDGTKLTGASIEIAMAALTAIHVPYEVRYMGPFQRVLDGAKNGEIDMIASLKETPERRNYLVFSKVPLFSNPVAVFVARNHGFIYSGWNDLIGKRGGIAKGNQFGGGFDEFMSKNLAVEVEQKVYMNFKKIELGRIDYLVTGYYTGMAYLKHSGQLGQFVALHPFVTESNNLLAIARTSPCLKHLPALDAQLNSMQQSGELKAILEKNIQAF